MTRSRLLNLLARTDKWYLGGNARVLWAPLFPVFHQYPGFWDSAQFFNYELRTPFTWTLLDDRGVEIPLVLRNANWTPAVLTRRFEATVKGHPLVLTEEKVVLPDDVLASVVRIINRSRKSITVHLVAWSAHIASDPEMLEETSFQDGIITFPGKLYKENYAPLGIHCCFSTNLRRPSYSISVSEGKPGPPLWQLTPCSEKFSGRLQSEINIGDGAQTGLLYTALEGRITLKPRKEESVSMCLSLGLSQGEARTSIEEVLKHGDPASLSNSEWTEYFNSLPRFSCSDSYLTNYYWYRWYGLRLNTITHNGGNYNHPLVCEGIEDFRAPIAYSAVCHMLENKWLRTPALAQGSLRTFIEHQREDGSFRGYIDFNHYREETFYHADWGDALLQLETAHPSIEFLGTSYEGLSKYAGYFDRARDEEGSCLYDIINHHETGQEYMHRYLAVEPAADRNTWGKVFRLKGVDVTTYVYNLKRTLSVIAAKLGRTDDMRYWNNGAERIRQAIRERMWDPEEQMFFDVDPRTQTHTRVKAATCFYPYMTDIVGREHLPGLKRHLFQPREFWTRYPVPSSSRDDVYFSAEAEWKGKRMNCPWNGRVWPMTNSHIAEALARTAIRFNDPYLKTRAAEFIAKFVRMMFFDSDPSRPNCFEHYNPFTGVPSLYRGIDDYQHSWVVDLILKYVCGIQPQADSIVIQPLPFRLKYVFVDNLYIRGRRIKVDIRGNRFVVWINGKRKGEQHIGQSLIVRA